MNVEKTKILIVDDDPFMREIMAALLEGEGYAVALAENGAEAFSEFGAEPGIGLVISDMNMPDMNGLQLTKKIRDRGSDVPVIILTGDAELIHDVDALKAGACTVLVKDENIQETIGFFTARALGKYKLEKQRTAPGTTLKRGLNG
jgi:DNA-binding NtrC family response regulator